MKRFLLSTALAFSVSAPAFAIGNIDRTQESVEPIIQDDGSIRLNNLSDVFNFRADGALYNTWFNNRPGDDEYKLTGDYRAQLYTGIVRNREGKNYENQGRLLTRVEGFSILDEDVNVFKDGLIDLPELFYRHDVKLPKDNEAFAVFGKFANRRFLDKDEITPDNFDIGERFHTSSFLDIGDAIHMGSIVNTNPIINVMNAARGFDRPGATDTGSYGFAFGLKDNDGETIFDRFSYTGAISTHKLESFSQTLSFSNELKKNWGHKNPGQIVFGYIVGGAKAFQVDDNGNGYLWYGSLIQKYKNFIPYARWGTFNSSFQTAEFTINTVSAGAFYMLGRKDMIGAHWTMFDSFFEAGNNTDHILRNLISATWKHRFNEYLASVAHLDFNVDQPKPSSQGNALDSNWTIGFGLQGNI